MPDPTFVPDDFTVPVTFAGTGFHLEPLGPEHNDADLEAWTSSIEHIRATPGFPDGSWPPLDGMSAADNERDLTRHANDFRKRTGFTYTVLDDNRVIGCVYIYPPSPRDSTGERVAELRCWVRADRAELDDPLRQAVSQWLESWPFDRVEVPGTVT